MTPRVAEHSLENIITDLFDVSDDEYEKIWAMWEDCDEIDMFPRARTSGGDEPFINLINVRYVYEAHKRAGFPQQFARFLMDSMDNLEEDWGIDAPENWIRKGECVLFKRLGHWQYDEYADEYFPTFPLVRGEIRTF